MSAKSLFPVYLTTFLAVGAVLAICIATSARSRPLAYFQLGYAHHQPEKFGLCPLYVEAVVNRNNSISIMWAAQTSAGFGCDPDIWERPPLEGVESPPWVSSVVARSEVRLSPARLEQAMADLYKIDWHPQRSGAEGLEKRPPSCKIYPSDSGSNSLIEFYDGRSEEPIKLTGGRWRDPPNCLYQSSTTNAELQAVLDSVGANLPATAALDWRLVKPWLSNQPPSWMF